MHKIFGLVALRFVCLFRQSQLTTKNKQTMARTTKYALLENGTIHTDNLTLADANEMKERHARIFDTHIWEVVPMRSTNGLEDNTQNGFLARHRRNAIRYHSR